MVTTSDTFLYHEMMTHPALFTHARADDRTDQIIRDAAERILGEDSAITAVDRIRNGRQHADVGFRSRDNQRVSFPLAQMRKEPWLGEAGIARLVDNGRGRAKGGQWRHQLQQIQVEGFAGRRPPARVIALLDQRRAGRKDRRKSQKQAPDDGPEAGGNKSGNHSHRPTESEPDQVLIPMGFP